MTEKYMIEIKKRPWYEWLLWALWFVIEVSLAQMAIASGPELEPRAGSIFWVSFFVLLFGGAVIWFMRRSK
ncbi:MAG TPA: hypothetical protein VGK00_02790 [Anaerolineales bacterium]|jgi:hypothetical protein